MMMKPLFELDFKKYLEHLNASGRAGQHVWKPETPILGPASQKPELPKQTKMKSIDLKSGFRPMHVAPFKGLQASDFGVKTKKLKSPRI